MPDKLSKQELQFKVNGLQGQILDGITKQQNLNQDIRKLKESNCHIQLENYQLRAQRDVLLACLADAQRRIQVLRIKTRPCQCGSGVNEDKDDSSMPFTDEAARNL